jgi:type IV pilus assembly protein PilN
MARINLLPWREALREERKQQFFKSMIGGVLIAAGLFFLATRYVNGLLDEQSDRNAFLQSEIDKVNLQIKEIEALDKEKNNLIARMQVIESLQLSRPKVVKTFDALVRSIPEGIHLDKMKRQGNSLTFDGVAQSNARVSVLMRELEDNTEFVKPTLNVIKRISAKDDAIRQFTLRVNESQLKENNGETDGLLE